VVEIFQHVLRCHFGEVDGVGAEIEMLEKKRKKLSELGVETIKVRNETQRFDLRCGSLLVWVIYQRYLEGKGGFQQDRDLEETLSDMVIDDELMSGFVEKLGWVLLKLAILKNITPAPSKQSSKADSVNSKASGKKVSTDNSVGQDQVRQATETD
jgi:hypothetical protein